MKYSGFLALNANRRGAGNIENQSLVAVARRNLGTYAMLKKLTHAGMALALIGATAITTAPTADAHGGRRTAGIVAGTVIGLGILGAYAASRDRYYYDGCYAGRPRCSVVGKRCWYNRYGEYVCKDDVRCYRPTRCD